MNPCELLAGIVEEFRKEPLAHGREIACDVRSGLQPIRADREALARALWNLLENAGKYSEPGSPGSPIRVYCAGVRGVGIGLALVKRIIEAHGGSVRLETEPGRGSTFLLELPCRGS